MIADTSLRDRNEALQTAYQNSLRTLAALQSTNVYSTPPRSWRTTDGRRRRLLHRSGGGIRDDQRFTTGETARYCRRVDRDQCGMGSHGHAAADHQAEVWGRLRDVRHLSCTTALTRADMIWHRWHPSPRSSSWAAIRRATTCPSPAPWPPLTVPRFGTADFQLTRLLQNRRFDMAQVAFLDCLRQTIEFVKKREEGVKIPYLCVAFEQETELMGAGS